MRDFTLYLWATPNSRRVSILFCELGLPFSVQTVNIRRGEQFADRITALNPAAKIPIVTWREDGQLRVLFESGAILSRFAERSRRFLPADGNARDEVMAWFMVALNSLGPITGQTHHWSELSRIRSEAALAHNRGLAERLYRLLDERLAGHRFLAGDYSVADIAAYPWVAASDWTTLDIRDYPHLLRWRDDVARRPAVARGMALPEGVSLEG